MQTDGNKLQEKTAAASVFKWLSLDGPRAGITGVVEALLRVVALKRRRIRRSYGFVKKWISSVNWLSAWHGCTSRVTVSAINQTWNILSCRRSLMGFVLLTVISIGKAIDILICKCVRIVG